jgi:hypothetical protein
LEKISAENWGVGGRLIMDRGKIMERKKLYWWGKPFEEVCPKGEEFVKNGLLREDIEPSKTCGNLYWGCTGGTNPRGNTQQLIVNALLMDRTLHEGYIT